MAEALAAWRQAVSAFPDQLQPLLFDYIDQFSQALLQASLTPPAHSVLEQPDAWLRLWASSHFTAEQMLRDPATYLSTDFLDSLHLTASASQWRDGWQRQVATLQSDEQWQQWLRRNRHQAMVRIIYRDCLRLSTLEETLADLSWLASLSIDLALGWLHQQLAEQYGEPHSRDGEPQRMVVLGMGKLGAGELNLSSDIDLMFCYPEAGETRGKPRTIDNQTFFTRLGQRLIQLLDQTTADGRAFRIDMRLRPYGQSGALALSFTAMEEYYEDQGRDWERYAMIKARPIAGDVTAGEHLLRELRPFVFRRYVDFSVIQSLRDMKALIERDLVRKQKARNIKLGAGGIRDIEFLVQSQQLVRGGKTPALQEPNLLRVLPQLIEEECLDATCGAALEQAYRFLRRLENALQALFDRQTQALPEDEVERWRLTCYMGYPTWGALVDELNAHCEAVYQQFQRYIRDQDDSTDDTDIATLRAAWQQSKPDALLAALREHLPSSADALCERLMGFRDERRVQAMPAESRQRLDDFIPRLLLALKGADDADLCLQRVLLLVDVVLRRTAYLVLLSENPQALDTLVTLCSKSLWVSQTLAQMPMLLDELVFAKSLLQPPQRKELVSELRQRLLRVPEDDQERQQEVLREFKHGHVLRVAASEILGTLPLMKVSDYLTWIAEVVLNATVDLAWQQLVAKHGEPTDQGEALYDCFAVVAYGKFGGIELSYGSDLDLVFLHHAPEQAMTRGPKPVANSVFFARLGQRIIGMLNAHTRAGQLYEIDMRLRPSGASGLLVTSTRAFARYQADDAWTWEHQALVRSRCVVGRGEVVQAFNRIRQETLSKPRDRHALLAEVCRMREKMLDSLSPARKADADPNQFDLKHDEGGIVDIEFMVQYAVLGWAASHPALLHWSDNIRLLETLADTALISQAQADTLNHCYKRFRALIHQQALQQSAQQIPRAWLADEPEQVRRIWRQLMEQGEFDGGTA